MERVLEPEYMDTPEEADGYDQMDHREPNLAFLERLVELGAQGKMLDIGTGPGHIPLLVAERIPDSTIIGIDMADHMLRHAERHRAPSPFRDRISFQRGDAKKLGYPDESFDCVFSNTILHHLPDPGPFLSESFRVLRRGGVLLIRDLFRPESEEDAQALVVLHASEANEYQKALFYASLCAAFTPDELREFATAAGLEGYEVVVDTDRHMSLQLSA